MGWHYLYLPYYNYPFILVPILGLLLTLLSLALTSTRQTCCSLRSNCCCTCFTLPRVEYGALVVAKPRAPFVLGANGKPELVPEGEEVKIEETEKQNDEMVELVDNQAGDNLDIDMV